MSVVKINVLDVPEERRELLEQRFANRAGEVEKVDGFESFELLRPSSGTDRYLVVTRWRDEDAFQAWLNSDAFNKGHAQNAGAGSEGGGQPGGQPGGHPGGHPGGAQTEGGQHSGPAAAASEVWGFEIVLSATKE